MKPENRHSTIVLLLILISICFFSCAREVTMPPISEVYAKFYSHPFYFGSHFFSFQNAFLNIVLFIFLFNSFQYWQNRRKDYLYYSAYLLIIWLYFLRTFPPYLYPFFSDIEQYEKFNNFIRPPGQNGGFNDQTEFIVFQFITISYLLFIAEFFNLKNVDTKTQKLTYRLIWMLNSSVFFCILILCFSNKYLNGLPLLIIKQILFIPCFFILFKIVSTHLPGSIYIMTGSGVTLISSVLIGVLHLTGDSVNGKRIFLQIGIFIEILFFSAALGKKDWVARKAKDSLENQFQMSLKNAEKSKQQPHDINLQDVQAPDLAVLADLNQFLEETFEKRRNGDKQATFSVSEIIQKLDKAHTTFYREIKQLTGKSIEMYVYGYRLNLAHQLITETKIPLKGIAVYVGFHDHSALTKAFQKFFGYPPSQLRKKGNFLA